MADGTRRPLIKKQPPPGAKIVPLGVKGAPRVIVKSPASGVDSHPVFTKKQLPGTVAKVHPVGKTVPSVPTVNSPPSSSSSSPSPSPLNKPLASPRAKILPSSLHLKTYPKSSHESSEEECLDHRKRVVETIDEEMKEKEESVNEKSEKKRKKRKKKKNLRNFLKGMKEVTKALQKKIT